MFIRSNTKKEMERNEIETEWSCKVNEEEMRIAYIQVY
jgi:hypothetical protein